MMKNRKVRFAIVIALVIALFSSSMMVSFAAGTSSKTKKMMAYQQVVIKGKYAYCSTGKGIYRVNLKTNKVKGILKENNGGGVYTPCLMKYYKGYLYYCQGGEGVTTGLYRIKPDGTKKKRLARITDYAIVNNTIYFTRMDYDYEKEVEVTYLKKMSLSGKNKKKTTYSAITKSKNSNVKGYKVKTVEKNGKCTDYLVKPNKKKIRLCSYEGYFYYD